MRDQHIWALRLEVLKKRQQRPSSLYGLSLRVTGAPCACYPSGAHGG